MTKVQWMKIDLFALNVRADLVRRLVPIYKGGTRVGYREVEKMMISCETKNHTNGTKLLLNREWPLGTNVEMAIRAMLTDAAKTSEKIHERETGVKYGE